jgi:hypothetical protein
MFYALPPDFQPRKVKIGKRVVVIEAPAAWLMRMARCGGVPPIPRKERNDRRAAA